MVSVCTTCKGLQKSLRALEAGITAGDAETEPVQWLRTTLPSLRQSSCGCRTCALLLQGILLHHQRFAGVDEDTVKISAESFNSLASQKQNTQDHLSVEIRWRSSDSSQDGSVHDHEHEHEHEHEQDDEERYPDLKLEFFTDQDGQSPFSAIGSGKHISDNLLQDSGIDAARSMLNECVSRHPKCRQATSGTLPKRVLDVRPQDGSPDIRLNESTERGEYVTLSHCWSTGQGIPKTTRSTLSANKQSIPWSNLPKTFQEAVAITRTLGLRWLWVDSLCIVQDDPADRLQESSKLDEIFSNAFLTIAATSAADSTEGCIMPKPQPFKIQATDNKGSLYRIYVREQPSHYSFKAPFSEEDHMNDWAIPFNSEKANMQAPLLKRAWAYCERLLSPRILHFTQSEMIMECREGYQCECGRLEDPIYDPRPADTVKQDFANITSRDSSDDVTMNGVDDVASQFSETTLTNSSLSMAKAREEAIQLWSYIVTEYTSRQLTYDQDRLLAIAGIAKQFSNTLKSGYIAGQWTFSIMDLLWYPSVPAQCRRPQQNGRNTIPSWSWASVEGSPIYFDNTTAMDLACTASYPQQDNGKFGHSYAWSPTTGDTVELTAAMTADVEFRIDDTDEFSLVKNNVSVEFRPDVGVTWGGQKLVSGETLICVLVSMTWRTSIIGFVLKADKSEPNVFRRVGRFECYECQQDDSEDEAEAEDAEALFGYWFPEVEDMTKLDDAPRRTFTVK